MNQQPLILFDGVCNLCCGWVMFLIKFDKKAIFQFASLQSEIGKKTVQELTIPINELESVIFIKDKQYFLYSDAVFEILQLLGGYWKLANVLMLISKPIRNYIYKQIAKKRYFFFGKRTACLIPNESIQKRFLS